MRHYSVLFAFLVNAVVKAAHFSTFGGGAQPVSRRANCRSGNIRKVSLTSSPSNWKERNEAFRKGNIFDRDSRSFDLQDMNEEWCRSGDNSHYFHPEDAPPIKFMSEEEYRARFFADMRLRRAERSQRGDDDDEDYDEYDDDETSFLTDDRVKEYMDENYVDEEYINSLGFVALKQKNHFFPFDDMSEIPFGARKLRLIPWRYAKYTVKTGFGFFMVGFALGGLRGLPWLVFRKVLGVEAPFIPETFARLKRWSAKGARWGLVWAKIGAPAAIPTLTVKWIRGVPYLDQYSAGVAGVTIGAMAGRHSRWQPYSSIICAAVLGWVLAVDAVGSKQRYNENVSLIEAHKNKRKQEEEQKKLSMEDLDDDDDEEE